MIPELILTVMSNQIHWKSYTSPCLVVFQAQVFFLYHNIKHLGTAEELVIDTNFACVPSFQPDCERYSEEPLAFNDYYYISTPQFKGLIAMQIQRKFPGPQSLTLSKKRGGGGRE